MAATIKDVARLAKVSFKSVSRVINNEASVSEELRTRVNAAIKALDYRPNPSARTLRGTSASIAFIYDNPNSNYVIELQNGMLQVCHQKGYELIIHPCDSRAAGLQQELQDMIHRSRIGGMIVTPPISEMPDIVRFLRHGSVPFVRILSGSAAPDAHAPCVFIDDRDAARDITQYLIDLGHRQICFLCGDAEHKSNDERLQGYREALAANGIPFRADAVVAGHFSFESGVERTRRLLNRKRRPTAVFAANDEIAAGVLFAARMLGVTVPQELSIAGFEDSPFSRQTWPKLTTAQQPNETIAVRAAELLIAAMRADRAETGFAETASVGFRPQLVVRESTCPVG